jgi:hypothetical protein
LRRAHCVRQRLAVGVVVLAVLAVGVVFLAGTGASAVGAVPGAQAQSQVLKGFDDPLATGTANFPMYDDLGVQIIEQDLLWEQVAPKRPGNPTDPNDPAYHWPAIVAQDISAARHYRIRIALQVVGAPPWANGGHAWPWAPLRAQDFANFVTAASRHYPSVHLWLIWSEPNRTGQFLPEVAAQPGTSLNAAQQQAPHRYAEILDAAYGALKRVSKANLVVGGMTYTTGAISTVQWIENLRLPNGKPPRLDFYGHNPFSWREPNLANPPSPDQQIDFSDLGRLASLVDQYLGRPGNRHPKLYVPEWTVPTQDDSEFNFYVDPVVQAQWIAAAWQIARSWPRIYAFCWIGLYDSPPLTYGGLIQTDGTKKPGYFAWKDG